MSDLDDLYPQKNAPPTYAETLNDSSTSTSPSDGPPASVSSFTALSSASQPAHSAISASHANSLYHSQGYAPNYGVSQQQQPQRYPSGDAIPLQPQQDQLATSSDDSDRPTKSNSLTPYQLLISDLFYGADFGEFCLSCWCAHCVAGSNQMKIRSSHNCLWFLYGCCCLDCCCCFLTQDVQRHLGAPVDSCLYLLFCHLVLRGLVISKERISIREWTLAGRPRYLSDGTVMV